MNALSEARQATGASESEVLFGGLEAELQELAASLEESFPENGTDQGGSSEQESEKLQNASKATDELTVALQEQIDQGLIDIEQREGSVFISVGAGGAFPSGTADLTEDAQTILDRIALTAMSPESKITVTGHTDDIPISNGKFRDNWDLAAARAASVVQAIEETGLVSGGECPQLAKVKQTLLLIMSLQRVVKKTVELKLKSRIKLSFLLSWSFNYWGCLDEPND